MELSLSFKNVGQGDTILFEWAESGEPAKFGLVDCNEVNGDIDCLLKDIRKKNIRSFEFVVMSHPHSDHFSGLLQLLRHCEATGIVIKQFFHTALFDPTYLNALFNEAHDDGTFTKRILSPVNRRKYKEMLHRLYVLLDAQARKKTFVKSIQAIGNNYPLPITDDVWLKFLSPIANEENKEYLTKTYRLHTQDKVSIHLKSENNPHANYFSSVLQLFHRRQPWQVLLFSDATRYTLTRLMEDEDLFAELSNRNLLAAQIPHHGSRKNHCPTFWKRMRELKDCHILLSVGEGYGHPHKTVIDFFRAEAKAVHATNFVGGYKESFTGQKPPSPAVLKLFSYLNVPRMGVKSFRGSRLRAPPPDLPTCCEKRLVLSIGPEKTTWDVRDGD